MYREEILDHYRNPRNSGRLEDAFDAEGENPSCGDHTHVYVEVENGEVKRVRHETDGCAISTAAMSVLSEELEGMEVERVKELDRDWMVEKLGIDVSPMRVKCAVLGLKTVQEALES
ncbi:MAG: iron-sulfur cluster assembly scaffold protein [Candidatus Nanohaloarchaea archaeon]